MRRAGWTTNLCLAGVLIVSINGGASASAAGRMPDPSPSTPTNVRAIPAVGSVTVTWRARDKVGVTFLVTSLPQGMSCSVIGATRCTMPDTRSTAWEFEVTASVGTVGAPPSALTAPLRTRTLLVLAGQSNAMGAESYAVDPATGTDYLKAPFANGADRYSTIDWYPWLVLPPARAPVDGQVHLDTPQRLEFPGTSPPWIFGPEIGWARQVYGDLHRAVSMDKVGIVGSLAVGWSASSSAGDFSKLVTQVTGTMAEDARRGQLDVVGAIAWQQGESDATSLADAQAYSQNLTTFIGALRNDLPMDPRVPIVVVKESLASFIAYSQSVGNCATTADCAVWTTGDTDVRAADDWVAGSLPHIVEVDTLGLPKVEGSVHLTNAAEMTLGAEIARASEAQMP